MFSSIFRADIHPATNKNLTGQSRGRGEGGGGGRIVGMRPKLQTLPGPAASPECPHRSLDQNMMGHHQPPILSTGSLHTGLSSLRLDNSDADGMVVVVVGVVVSICIITWELNSLFLVFLNIILGFLVSQRDCCFYQMLFQLDIY